MHDPNYKPPHAVVDKWYRTEAGSKNTLAGCVEESRWQSCHSMQTGREPRKRNGSRLPLGEKKASPGPASYHIRDPWEVRVRYGYLRYQTGSGFNKWDLEIYNTLILFSDRAKIM